MSAAGGRRSEFNPDSDLHKKAQECRGHAAYCARNGRVSPSDDLREDFFQLERSWLRLARSYEAADELLGAAVVPGRKQ